MVEHGIQQVVIGGEGAAGEGTARIRGLLRDVGGMAGTGEAVFGLAGGDAALGADVRHEVGEAGGGQLLHGDLAQLREDAAVQHVAVAGRGDRGEVHVHVAAHPELGEVGQGHGGFRARPPLLDVGLQLAQRLFGLAALLGFGEGRAEAEGAADPAALPVFIGDLDAHAPGVPALFDASHDFMPPEKKYMGGICFFGVIVLRRNRFLFMSGKTAVLFRVAEWCYNGGAGARSDTNREEVIQNTTKR